MTGQQEKEQLLYQSTPPRFAEQTYHIYCQAPKQPTFHLLNLAEGRQARRITEATKITAREILPTLAKLSRLNPGWKFHVRPARGQTAKLQNCQATQSLEASR